MIVIAVVVGIAVAISVAGWVPLIRDARASLRPDPFHTSSAPAPSTGRPGHEPEALPEAVSA